MHLIYNTVIRAYAAGIRIASLFSNKARHWSKGRRGWRTGMERAFLASQAAASPVIWFHCASLGEFEQGRPVIEAFRKKHPGWRVLLTFFSPSGYEIRKNYPLADHVFYLPVDTPSNARDFINIWNPSVAVFVKYEYWFNFFGELTRRRIPVYVISAIFRKEQHFFKFYGKWFIRKLRQGVVFFVQDQASLELLKGAGVENVVISGDTRFDRVFELSSEGGEDPVAAELAGEGRLLVAGSTWPADEELLAGLYRRFAGSIKMIIAPHEVHTSNIDRLESLMEGAVRSTSVGGSKLVARYSELGGKLPENTSVLIIDRIGLLSGIYRYGDMAYIGGGFGKGIHNILEPASFGLPVFFGPRYGKFAEACDLIRLGGAASIDNGKELAEAVGKLLDDEGELKKRGKLCSDYVKRKKGATPTIMQYLDAALNSD